MKAPLTHFRRKFAAALPELLVGTVVASIILGALMVGSIALQRAFKASDLLARTNADLTRVADYMSRDVRNATSINTAANSSVILTVTVGDYYDRRGTPNNPADDIPNSPTLGRTGAIYGTSAVTIRYLRSGSRILREVSRIDGGKITTSNTWIADNVNNLTVTVGADRAVKIASAANTHYGIRKTGAASTSVSLVMVAQSRNLSP
ncbi:MAG: hypothetical protein ABMA13_12570 [Chthoniobacteraceae bacterium]